MASNGSRGRTTASTTSCRSPVRRPPSRPCPACVRGRASRCSNRPMPRMPTPGGTPVRRFNECAAGRPDEAVAHSDVVVLIHPNKPTGVRFGLEQLAAWHARLAARNGWLVVDEAFMDATPAHSLCVQGTRPGLIVLRSLCKFFGLTGARVGFVIARPALLGPLRELLGPWHLSARPLDRGSRPRRQGMAGEHSIASSLRRQAPAARAQRGILTRLFAHCPGIRFGLPATESEWHLLAECLSAL